MSESETLAGPSGEAMPTGFEFVDLPAWSSELANLYYRKRYCRLHDHAGRRRAWRKIAVEEKRLLAGGVNYLELHLVCRVLTNPRNKSAADRWRRYQAQLVLFW